MIKIKSLQSVKGLKGKTVLLRVAYDIPLAQRGKNWVVADDRRITETVPTIKYLLKHNCKIVLLSWLSRPGGKIVEKYRMDPVAKKLSEILGRPVKKIDDCIGPKVFAEIKKIKPGSLLMLENVRFYHQEEENDKRFAKLLVAGIDLIVFDAFGQSHRIHASTVGITKLRPTYAGFLLEKELTALAKVTVKPVRPLVVVLGGAKISDKVSVLQQLVKIADHILIGGGLANIFLQAAGQPVGQSFVEDIFVDKAKRKKINFSRLAKKIYQKNRQKIVLPKDLLAANKIDAHALVEIIDLEKKEQINPHWTYLDIGPKTIAEYLSYFKKAKTIFWNGPMGVFEIPKFALGTKRIAQAIARSKAVTVLGGGDTESVIGQYNLNGQFTHVSTGGGASLEFLAGHELPALKHLVKK